MGDHKLDCHWPEDSFKKKEFPIIYPKCPLLLTIGDGNNIIKKWQPF